MDQKTTASKTRDKGLSYSEVLQREFLRAVADPTHQRKIAGFRRDVGIGDELLNPQSVEQAKAMQPYLEQLIGNESFYRIAQILRDSDLKLSGQHHVAMLYYIILGEVPLSAYEDITPAFVRSRQGDQQAIEESDAPELTPEERLKRILVASSPDDATEASAYPVEIRIAANARRDDVLQYVRKNWRQISKHEKFHGRKDRRSVDLAKHTQLIAMRDAGMSYKDIAEATGHDEWEIGQLMKRAREAVNRLG